MISKIIVVQNDRRAADAVRMGFEREGATVITAEHGEAAAALLDAETGLVVAGAEGADPARALLACLKVSEAPILWVGNGVRREEAWAAGADEVLEQPAFVRDVVTIGKLLAGRKKGYRTTINGDLGDYFGVFYMVRALAATGRSGVLTLVRGLRRGEMRLFEGEVTSAHMGGMHGQAGFHQLLLWTEARFEWRHEKVVRRQQIPMPHEEVLSQAERFLSDIREVSGGLSPAAVYEQDVQKIQAMARKLPTEVHGVLRLFDGNRTIADVLEDSSFRVFETLRVALRAVEVGLLRLVQTAKPKAAMRAVLAVEEWLVGGESKDAVISRTMALPESEPAPARPAAGGTGGKKKNKGKKRGGKDSGPSRAIAPEVDWASLVPRSTSVDMSTVTGVVPSAEMHGEIETGEVGGAMAARREGREGLEALTDVEERSRMFPASVTVDLGPEPEPAPPPEPTVITMPRVATQESLEDAMAAAAAIHAPAVSEVSTAVAEAMAEAAEAAAEESAPVDAAVAAAAPVAEAEPAAAPAPAPAAAAAPAPAPAPEPSDVTERIPKEELIDPPAVVVEPAILVDLAAVHAAVANVVPREHSRPPTAPPKDAHDPATSAEISAVRLDADQVRGVATHFSDDEEEFFRAGQKLEQKRPPPTESFADLDEGYQPEGFWDRLRGKRDTKKP